MIRLNAEFEQKLKTFREISSLFNENLNNGFSLLSKYGWYIEGNIRLIDSIELVVCSKKNEKKKIDIYFKKYYSKNIKKLSEEISSKHSNRAKIIVEGLQTHNQKLYFASTQLFLSQADGICGGELFKTGRNKEMFKKYLKKTNNGDYISTFLIPITSESAIDVYHPEKAKYFSELNRHGVMHGFDTDFGTELNSLKAFSLLCFVSDFIDRYNENK